MKSKILAVSLVVVVFLAIAGSASAFVWHLSVPVARHNTERLMKSLCEEEGPECTGWAGSQCERISESRVDCLGATWSPGYSIEEEIECYLVLHWGVSYKGVVELKNRGKIKCIPVEPS